MFEEFQHRGITYTCVRWILLTFSAFAQEIQLSVFSDADNYCILTQCCSVHSTRSLLMPMLKVVLLARTLFLFILFCREGLNGSKSPKPKKGISNILRSCPIFFFEVVPENLFQTSSPNSQIAICTTEQLTCVRVFLRGLYFHLCSLFSFALH